MNNSGTQDASSAQHGQTEVDPVPEHAHDNMAFTGSTHELAAPAQEGDEVAPSANGFAVPPPADTGTLSPPGELDDQLLSPENPDDKSLPKRKSFFSVIRTLFRFTLAKRKEREKG